MPYNNKSELPSGVQDNLPKHAQDIYKEAFNNAYQEYKDPDKRRDNVSREEIAHRVAWSAVKNKYEKDANSGKWQKK